MVEVLGKAQDMDQPVGQFVRQDPRQSPAETAANVDRPGCRMVGGYIAADDPLGQRVME